MSTISIPLTQGKSALIDAEDLPLLGDGSWSLAERAEGFRTRFYAQGFINRNMVLMHRVILGARSGQTVDHINGDGLDNRRSNLRLVTPSQNNQNQPKKPNGTSIYKGVSRTRSGKWLVMIQVNREVLVRKRYLDEVEAARAYDDLARTHFGEFGRFNFPREGERSALDHIIKEAS